MSWLARRDAEREAAQVYDDARRLLLAMTQSGALSCDGIPAGEEERWARAALAGDPWLDELDEAYAATPGEARQ